MANYELIFRDRFKVDKQGYRFTSLIREINGQRVVEETVQIVKPYDDASYYWAKRSFLECDLNEDTDEKRIWRIIRDKKLVTTVEGEGKLKEYKVLIAEALHEMNKTVEPKMMHS